MPANTSASTTVTVGPLPRTDFKSWQEAADAIVRAMTVSVEIPDQSSTGKNTGTSLAQKKTSRLLTAGVTSVDMGFDVSNCALVLVRLSDAPAVSIKGVSGTSHNVIHFTGAIVGDDNSLVATRYE